MKGQVKEFDPEIEYKVGDHMIAHAYKLKCPWTAINVKSPAHAYTKPIYQHLIHRYFK